MSPADAVRSVYRNYANFSGRATRSEFWWFVGFLFLAYFLTLLAGAAFRLYSAFVLVALVFWLLSLIPYLAVTVRRLHDSDRSGWWLLASFIPFGGLILLIFFVSGSSPYPNRYGPPPYRFGADQYGNAQDWSQWSPQPHQWGVTPDAGSQDWTHPLSRNPAPPPEGDQ